jgi:hypothetical protein
MKTASVKEAWISLMKKDLGPHGYFDAVKSIEREGLFTHWRRTTVPVSMQYLDVAIDLLCGAPEQTELIATFIGYVRQQIERAKTEPQRWEREESGEWGSSFMKAERWYDLHRADLYTQALLGEEFGPQPMHFEALQASAAEYGALPTRFWDELFQPRLIGCAVTAAAWGRPDLAQTLLKTRRSFKCAQRYLDWSRSLVDQLLQLPPGQVVGPDEPLWTHFHSLFDEVRHPALIMKVGEASREAARRGETLSASSLPLWRLELAMIKQRYLLNKPVARGMRDLIALISE